MDSQFLICGRKHVVFGKVLKGLEVVKKIEQVGTADGKPIHPVKIVECGEASENKIQAAVGKDAGNPGVYLGSDMCISLSEV